MLMDPLGEKVRNNMSNFRIYNYTLCPVLWDKAQHLDPQVRASLLKMAYDFYEKTDLKAPVLDVYLMGSIANYNWTNESDADVHVIIDFTQLQMPPDTAKSAAKTMGAQWNMEHKASVKGYKVELNIQDAKEEKPYVTGIYSLVHDTWVRKPIFQNVQVDTVAVQSKFQGMKKYIDSVINSGDREMMKSAKKYLDAFRQFGLDHGGELSVENIVFKILRARGIVKKLKDSITMTYDKEMTVKEGGHKKDKPYPPDAKFGIGAIGSNDDVQFKPIPRDIMGNQPHGYHGNPWGRRRFRYYNGEVEWSDCARPDAEQIQLVNNYLSHRGYPVTKHTSIYDNVDEVVQKDIKAKFPLPTALHKDYEKLHMMTLDNLKSMRDKAARLNKWTTQQKEPNPEYLRWSQAQYEKYDKEIKRRLAYINKPVNEKKKLAAKDPYQDEFELGHHAPKFDPGSLSHDIDRVRETNQNEFDMGQKHQTWNLLPARDLVLLWATFAKYGRVDEKRLLKLFGMLSELVIKISLNTDVWQGHDSGFFYKDDFREISDEENERFAWFISDRSGSNWVRNTGERGGNARYSDQSDRLYELLEKCYNSDTPEELLINMDLILNFVHGMGNMAKWFVEGGTDTLDKIRDFQVKGIHLAGQLTEETPVKEGVGAGDPSTDPIATGRWRVKFGGRKTPKMKGE